MADTTPSEAAARLRARLDELGWSQVDLAKAIDVTPAVVSRWLSSERVPSLEMAFRIQESKVGLEAEIWRKPPSSGADATGPQPVAPPDAPTQDKLEDEAADKTPSETALAAGAEPVKSAG